MKIADKIIGNIIGNKKIKIDIKSKNKKYYCSLCGLERPKEDIYYDGKKPVGCSECAYLNKE